MADIKEIKDLELSLWSWMTKTFCYGRNMWVFLDARGKLKIVTSAKPTSTEKTFEEWERKNYLVMTWVWNSMESKESANFMFLDTAKEFEKLFVILIP